MSIIYSKKHFINPFLMTVVVKLSLNALNKLFALFADSLYTFSEEKKKLHIAYNLTITEIGGCYTCVVENSEGIAVANFILTTRNGGIEILIKQTYNSHFTFAIVVCQCFVSKVVKRQNIC